MSLKSIELLSALSTYQQWTPPGSALSSLKKKISKKLQKASDFRTVVPNFEIGTLVGTAMSAAVLAFLLAYQLFPSIADSKPGEKAGEVSVQIILQPCSLVFTCTVTLCRIGRE